MRLWHGQPLAMEHTPSAAFKGALACPEYSQASELPAWIVRSPKRLSSTTAVAFEGALTCPGDGVPYSDRVVVGAADQVVAMHHQAYHSLSVAFECEFACPGALISSVPCLRASFWQVPGSCCSGPDGLMRPVGAGALPKGRGNGLGTLALASPVVGGSIHLVVSIFALVPTPSQRAVQRSLTRKSGRVRR
jgi:hypothetical protein